MRQELAALTEEQSASCSPLNGWTHSTSVHFVATPITDGPAGELVRIDFTPAEPTI